MSWKPRTRADVGDTAPVRAPCCGRRVWPDVLVDCARLPVEVRPRGASDLCDGCRETLLRDGWVTHEALLVALGAPPDLVARARARDVARRTR